MHSNGRLSGLALTYIDYPELTVDEKHPRRIEKAGR